MSSKNSWSVEKGHPVEQEIMKPIRIMFAILFLISSPCILYGKSDIYVTRKDYPMAISETDLDLFRYSMEENHMGLWVKLRQEHKAWLSVPGLEVVVIEKKEPNKVRIRRVDSTETFWTYEDALEKK